MRREVLSFTYRQRKLGDSNPRYGNPYVSLANWWFQPLTQTSNTLCRIAEKRFVLSIAGAKIVIFFIPAKEKRKK